jgi:hypothetical protein
MMWWMWLKSFVSDSGLLLTETVVILICVILPVKDN